MVGIRAPGPQKSAPAGRAGRNRGLEKRAWVPFEFGSHEGVGEGDARSKDHHGKLVIATALARWSAIGRPSARVEVGKLEDNW